MKVEYIQFFACKNKIQPIVVVDETRIIPFAEVIINNWRTEYKVPKASKDIVLGFISWTNIRAPGNFCKVVAQENAKSLMCSIAVINQKWNGATASLIINIILMSIP